MFKFLYQPSGNLMNNKKSYKHILADLKKNKSKISAEISANPAKFIPFGFYCYRTTNELTGNFINKYKNVPLQNIPDNAQMKEDNNTLFPQCPFREERYYLKSDGTAESISYCHYLQSHEGLIWDKVKECDVKPYFLPEFEDYVQSNIGHPADYATEDLHYIYNLVFYKCLYDGDEFYNKESFVRTIKDKIETDKILTSIGINLIDGMLSFISSKTGIVFE